MSIGIDFGIGIDQNSWYRTGIVSKPKKLVSPITNALVCSVSGLQPKFPPFEIFLYKQKYKIFISAGAKSVT
jgi:hypothetical protein